MPHQFSVEIHDYISQQLQEARLQSEKAVAEQQVFRQQHARGQIEILEFYRDYLGREFDLKNHDYY